MATCWCGHESGSHRVTVINDPWKPLSAVISASLHECQAEWSERGGKDRVHCNCEQFAPELASR